MARFPLVFALCGVFVLPALGQQLQPSDPGILDSESVAALTGNQSYPT